MPNDINILANAVAEEIDRQILDDAQLNVDNQFTFAVGDRVQCIDDLRTGMVIGLCHTRGWHNLNIDGLAEPSNHETYHPHVIIALDRSAIIRSQPVDDYNVVLIDTVIIEQCLLRGI